MMKNLETNTSDTPSNWGPYADLLRNQPAPAMPADRARQMLPAIHAAIPAFTRRQRTIRFLTAPALTIAAAALVTIVSLVPATLEEQHVAPTPAVTTAAAKSQQRPARRLPRTELAPPVLSDEQLAASADTAALPPRNFEEPVHMREMNSAPGPGIARYPADPNAMLP